ncbi:hypothetical protein, partial [Massilia scottii]|uniref:hypothetical protein n=1 Tax=Massilia scottii TaxID=3057166 RepID=UPI0027967A7B
FALLFSYISAISVVGYAHKMTPVLLGAAMEMLMLDVDDIYTGQSCLSNLPRQVLHGHARALQAHQNRPYLAPFAALPAERTELGIRLACRYLFRPKATG